ncbi:hypothetical protein JYU34_007683 [Plutella xylostella]|uniref:Uncharacterized protein n=1 Tax=Plutella xylostella TaxID=51655 RepID=A0ABQ7QR30_PLUXY|nr:hypothetical protein JYU34_007683 [Plutella xylostella]
MVNYRRVLEAAVLALLAAAAAAAPADCDKAHTYDQRQNGSENYRLNIDGVVIAVAPADALLSAASELDFSDLLELQDYDAPLKPPGAEKPIISKPGDPKPDDAKPGDAKPEDAKPDAPLSDVSLNNDVKGQKKEAFARKQEKAQRLKMRLANMLIPLLRKTRHH